MKRPSLVERTRVRLAEPAVRVCELLGGDQAAMGEAWLSFAGRDPGLAADPLSSTTSSNLSPVGDGRDDRRRQCHEDRSQHTN